jgi:hypothetical protein
VHPDRLESENEEARIIPFRRPGRLPTGWTSPDDAAGDASPVGDLAKFEQDEPADDYRQRMRMNVVGLVVTIALMVAGIWLVATLAQMQRNQDCFLSGRRNCAPIENPANERG